MQKFAFLAAAFAAMAFSMPEMALPQGSGAEGKPLSGYYIGPGEEIIPEAGEQALAEGGEGVGTVSAIQNLPVIDDDLADKAMELDPTEYIRVIIFLDYLPHDVIASQVQAKYAREIMNIREEIKEIHAGYTVQRRQDTSSDQENYSGQLLDMSNDERETLREINERNEALSLTMHREAAAVLNAEIERYQESVKVLIEQIGGEVEFGTTAGNAVIALVPAGALDEIASIDKVARVASDRRMEQDLNIAADATRVNASGGLWANGEDGGAYDPAVLDSGTDLNHPGLEADTGRENHWSWYLVSGISDPLYNDYTGIDDRNGHGTHVMGIVGSYGTTSYPDHLGMAHGAEKMVHLKAAFHRTDGRASMYRSDAMWLVDRALYHQEQLYPTYGIDEFNDDVDGINLSYSGETDLDETDYSRFWDSVVSSYTDTVVTLSAGNSGPSNTYFRSPACSYNAITVANVNDQNTADRSDDTIWSSSTRGPTENGRRKPDIAAPGSYISSCNTFWETQSDYINKSGTSMSTPMIQGLAMALMDAGVIDEKEIKALLINTAQKNEPGINFESDSDGWSEAYGWGYVNAWAAYYHRADVDSYTVTERDTSGDYILLSGQMRDEGSLGEGRDRVTMVWNRHATYNPHDYPSTYHALSNLNLRLYRETDNYFIDYDTTVYDNVHQVRINSGASSTDVVVKAYAWSTDFPHGGSTESFALATEEDFVQVDLPSQFQGIHYSWPGEVEPNEVQEYRFAVRNDSEIAGHNNQMDLVLPTGWSYVSGDADPYSAGSIENDATSSIVTWRLRAQPTVQDNVRVSFNHSHNSYAEAWGPFNWGNNVNVRWDTTPPTPNPMTWAVEPYQLSTSQMRMVATTASDLHDPVMYHFWRDLSAGGESTDLGYHTSSTYSDSGLATNTQYRYWVQARDSATNPNNTSWSSPSYEYTAIEAPTGVDFYSTFGSNYIHARSTNTPSGLDRGSSGLIIYNVTAGTNSGWKQNNNWWYSSGLTPNTQYGFRARARNGDGDTTDYSGYAYLCTLAALPGAAAFSATQTSIRANWTANGNPAGTEYYCENTTQGTGSGWTTGTSWNSTGLACDNSYSFRVRARNADGTATNWVSLGAESTQSCDAPPVIDDIAFDSCVSELCTAAISVTAHDPAGGTLTYSWTPLNGGAIDGSGADVVFNPSDGPHPCPYRVEVTVTSSVSGLSDDETVDIYVKLAGDVDGSETVNIIDRILVINAFGSEPGDPNWEPRADVDCSGRVNIVDRIHVINQFGDSGCGCP